MTHAAWANADVGAGLYVTSCEPVVDIRARMHRLRVQPGESLGPFVLGMSLNDVVALLARRPTDTPRAAAPWGRVELVYDPKVSRVDELSPLSHVDELSPLRRVDELSPLRRLVEPRG